MQKWDGETEYTLFLALNKFTGEGYTWQDRYRKKRDVRPRLELASRVSSQAE